MNPFITAHRALLLVALLLASSVGASTITPQIGGGINQFDGGISNGGGSVTPPTSGALLLEDGSSILLLEDGTSQLCLEGGC